MLMTEMLVMGLIILLTAVLLGFRGLLRCKCLGKCAGCPFFGKCCRKKRADSALEISEPIH